jgi:uncharacterized damage-inducible protein DinB
MKKKVLNLPAFCAVMLASIAMIATPHLQAQSSMTHPTSATATPTKVVDQLLSIVEGELVPLAEAMPADKYSFAPSNGEFKGVRTFGEQLKHVIQANNHMFADAASIQPTSMPKMDELKTKAQIVQALKDSFAFGHRAIATLNGDNALETVKPVDGINTRAGVMLFAIIHMNDHYGQLVEYLRMNGIVPPSSRRSMKK